LHVMNFLSFFFFVWLSYSNSRWNINHPPSWCKNASHPVVFLSMRHMPCFWTDSLPFPRYWPLGLSFLYFQDNSNKLWIFEVWSIASSKSWIDNTKTVIQHDLQQAYISGLLQYVFSTAGLFFAYSRKWESPNFRKTTLELSKKFVYK
jgi:hypothetical protein